MLVLCCMVGNVPCMLSNTAVHALPDILAIRESRPAAAASVSATFHDNPSSTELETSIWQAAHQAAASTHGATHCSSLSRMSQPGVPLSILAKKHMRLCR